jgi:hypothetical protein
VVVAETVAVMVAAVAIPRAVAAETVAVAIDKV